MRSLSGPEVSDAVKYILGGKMDTSVGVVVLASGNQFPGAGLKNLQPLFYEPAIARCVGRVLDSGIKDIVVVTGPDGYEVGAALANYPVCIVVSSSSALNTLARVKLGIKALPSYTTGVIVASDCQSGTSVEKYDLLAQFHHSAPHYAVIPDRQRHMQPVLIPVEMPPVEMDNIIHLEQRLEQFV